MSTRSEFEDAIVKEVGEWPGATVEFEMGGKHPVAILKFSGLSVKRPFAGTTSDSRFGKHRMLGDLRRALKSIMAERNKPESSADDGDDAQLSYRKPVDRSGVKSKSELVAKEPVVQSDPRDVLKAIAPPAEEVELPKPDLAPGAPDPAPERERGPAEAQQTDEAREAALAAIRAIVEAIEDGVYFGLPAEIYHEVPRLSSSGLQKLVISAGTFWKGSWLDPNRPEPDADQTPAQLLGKAYHVARLEPELFDGLYCRAPAKDDYRSSSTCWTGTDIGGALERMGQTKKRAGENVLEQARRLEQAGYDGAIWPLVQARFEETERQGRIPIDAAYYDQLVLDMATIKAEDEIAQLLSGGAAEVSIFWTDEHGIKMKARTDYLAPGHWADLKTFDNTRGVELEMCLINAVQYNRLHIQAGTYRDAVEAIRTGGLRIIGDATDPQRKLIAGIQMSPSELECHFVFQEKNGVPNLLSREFVFHEVPQNVTNQHAGASAEGIARMEEATRTQTQLFRKARFDIERAKKTFYRYSNIYKPGEPWRQTEPRGKFYDSDFRPFWLESRG